MKAFSLSLFAVLSIILAACAQTSPPPTRATYSETAETSIPITEAPTAPPATLTQGANAVTPATSALTEKPGATATKTEAPAETKFPPTEQASSTTTTTPSKVAQASKTLPPEQVIPESIDFSTDPRTAPFYLKRQKFVLDLIEKNGGNIPTMDDLKNHGWMDREIFPLYIFRNDKDKTFGMIPMTGGYLKWLFLKSGVTSEDLDECLRISVELIVHMNPEDWTYGPNMERQVDARKDRTTEPPTIICDVHYYRIGPNNRAMFQREAQQQRLKPLTPTK